MKTSLNLVLGGIAALLTLVSIAQLSSAGALFHTSGDVRSLFPRQSESLSEFEQTTRLFGDSVPDFVIVDVPEELDEDTELQLLEFADTVRALSGVLRVSTPLEGFSNAEFPVQLVNRERLRGRFVVEIDGTLDDSARKQLDAELQALLPSIQALRPLRVGSFAISEAAAASVERENRRWTPLAFLALFCTCALILRTLIGTLIVLLPPVLSLLWFAAGMSRLSIALNPLCQLIPPLALAIAASYSMYVASRWLTSGDSDSAAPGSERKLIAQCRNGVVLAAGTTIVGFLSLALLNAHAVTEFGLLMSVSTVLSATLALLVTPKLLTAARFRLKQRPPSVSLQLGLSRFIRREFAVGILVIALVAVPGLWQLQVDTDPLTFLPKGSQQLADFIQAKEDFPGTRVLSVVFQTADRTQITSPAGLALLARIQTKIQRLPHVTETVSAAEFVSYFAELERKGIDVSAMLDFEQKKVAIPLLTTEDRATSRILVETDSSGVAMLELIEQVDSILSSELEREFAQTTLKPGALKTWVSSVDRIMAEQAQAIAHGLLGAVVSALIVVGVLLLFASRSLVVACIGLLPSLVPIAILFGGLGYFFPEISLGTAMVAATALGMVSDNTFHYLVVWRERRAQAGAAVEAATITFVPFMQTTLVLVFGFSATDFSSVQPVREFGIFLGIALVLGTICNAVCLPWYLQCVDDRSLGTSGDRTMSRRT